MCWPPMSGAYLTTQPKWQPNNLEPKSDGMPRKFIPIVSSSEPVLSDTSEEGDGVICIKRTRKFIRAVFKAFLPSGAGALFF